MYFEYDSVSCTLKEIKKAIKDLSSNPAVKGGTFQKCMIVINGSLENLEDSINKNAKSNTILSFVIAGSSLALAVVGIINIFQ